MHQNSPFEGKIEKFSEKRVFFSSGEGTPSPHSSRRLRHLDPRAFGAPHRRLRRHVSICPSHNFWIRPWL